MSDWKAKDVITEIKLVNDEIDLQVELVSGATEVDDTNAQKKKTK
jgi:hypothetical protein